ncbi:uncharacterized protein LOC106945046 [Poecilia latipinna]|uniref:uncharacterized protein LOC106945046 n=1 Tax=Poecilia latipinna TaxID=48699 RepID=UPI00072E888D|nr:PREDICTED: uncharacterized protein LOC106945046 [Poecilia latipinna]
MKLLELGDSIGRFRFAQSCLGLAGCVCVCYSICTPHWLKDKRPWLIWNNNSSNQERDGNGIPLCEEAERVFGVISLLMALSTAALCLVFALCWTSKTVHSYSNTRSLLMAGQALFPTTLLFLTMASTGFFFLLSWSLFTYEHRKVIDQDFSSLGLSYWLGALGWILLLVVETVVFITEQAVVPNIIPDLEKAVETLSAARYEATKSPVSEGYKPVHNKSILAPQRFMSVP